MRDPEIRRKNNYWYGGQIHRQVYIQSSMNYYYWWVLQRADRLFALLERLEMHIIAFSAFPAFAALAFTAAVVTFATPFVGTR